MDSLPLPYTICVLITGLFWTITYVLIIKRGFQDKSYGMPMWVLSTNISWEFIYSFVTPAAVPQRYVNIVWVIFDVIILYQFLKYWKQDYGFIDKKYFYPFYVLVLATSFLGLLFIQYDAITVMKPSLYPLGMGRAYTAFGTNLIMSILFLNFIFTRKNVKGQSLYIAIAKCVGTVFAGIPLFMYPEMPRTPGADEYLFPYFYISIFIFDAIYIVLVYNKSKELGLNPWKRL
jgi:hypothetical protein